MTKKIRRSLLSAAALVLAIGPGLSSCSKSSEQNATEPPATEQTATAPAAEQEANMDDQSAQNAKALLKAMSDYLAAQKTISMSFNSIFEVVSGTHQKLQIATSGTVDLERPDKIHTTRKSGFSDTEMTFDGKTLSFLGKSQNAYIQAEAPGTIDTLIDQLTGGGEAEIGFDDACLADLAAERARRAVSVGCLLSIDSDAHYIKELDYVRWGISQARRAWVTPADVVNTRSRADLLAWTAAKPERV